MVRVAFLFPGQGAQYVGMGRALCMALPAARALFDEASGLLGFDLLEVCANGPAERLGATAVSQPALFVASLAALEALRASEPEAVAGCEAAAGLSLGEYTALVFADALSLRDGLRLVRRRGEAMQAAADAAPGAMVSVMGPDLAAVEGLCAAARALGRVRVANILCPGNLVVSGDRAACEEVERLAEGAGAKTVRLAVAGAFHTELMRPAAEALAPVLDATAFAPTRVPVWANVSARPHGDAASVRRLLGLQVVEPVRWEETLRGLLADGFDRFYEVGPGRVLAGLLKRVQRKVDVRNVGA